MINRVEVESVNLVCRCGHSWNYKGKRIYYTCCPNCRANVRIRKRRDSSG
jgi:Zn finger protein HypA/HybF involved in hydrogenase expression